MNNLEIVAFIVVPVMCTVGFVSLCILIGFCFKIANKVTKLEGDYSHMDKNLKQGLAGVQIQLDQLSANIGKLLDFAAEERGRRAEDKDRNTPVIKLPQDHQY